MWDLRDLKEVSLFGFSAPQVNVNMDKELLSIFAISLVSILGVVVTIIKIFLKMQEATIRRMVDSNEALGEKLSKSIRVQTNSQEEGVKETNAILVKLNESQAISNNRLEALISRGDTQVEGLRRLNDMLIEHDTRSKDYIFSQKKATDK